MAISQNITPLSTPPSRSDPTNFDSRADTFLAELPTLATQINTWAGQANSTAAAVTSDASSAATAKTNAETAEAHAETAQGLAESARNTAIAQASTAAASAATATSQAASALASATSAGASAVTAQAAAANAAAVVTGGTATLTPTAGKIPLADGSGKIDSEWVDTDLTPVANGIPKANASARVDGDWIGVMADKLTSVKDAFNELTAVQQYLIFNMEGLAGYWPADPAYLYQDSAGYTPATVGGVVGQVRDISNAATPVARRNLLTYSEQFDNAAWVKTACTVEASSVPSPDGTATAQLIRDIIGGLAYTYATSASVSVLSTDTLTYSIYLKAGTSSSGQIEIGSTTDSQRAIAIFNLTNKTITVGYNGGGTVTNSVRLLELSGGWFRASISIATNSAYNAKAVLTFWNTNGLDYHVCDGTNNMYIWGAQFELGAEATPYQKIVTGTGDVFAPGNHAYQTTTANKPYLRVTPTSGVHWLDSNTATSALTATLGNLGSACTVCRAGAEGVTFTEGVTISSTYNLVPYDASELIRYCADVAIFDRALTITEKALLTRYMGRGVPIVTNGSIY